ncbi:hypothetical protein [Blastococcus sp. VKM Ac-2987]|uniref:hypothetical protein n=1 Tax=Blastococcus sp. VKM Ac-2987 TaxID=3004141 RepID=UPI0022AB8B1B|nr:hypothetical protein [Blastococcus sp. VKM Ac-2987]MCZ2859473.1 hypothetical protein [Blastococcus sp. VKM Ac-2987]
MSGRQRTTVVAIVDVPPEATAAFQRYESLVLPLLGRYGGRLERRLRNPDGSTEVHVLSFPADGDYRRYLSDPERGTHRALLSEVPVTQRVVESLTDV